MSEPATVPKTAYMHEQSLDDIGTGKIVPFKRKRKSPTKGYHVGHITVDPRVWKVAMKLAKGNAYRIQVRDAECVTVHNGEGWRK